MRMTYRQLRGRGLHWRRLTADVRFVARDGGGKLATGMGAANIDYSGGRLTTTGGQLLEN